VRGCGLAAVCDFSVAVPRAKFGFTEVRIGFVPAIVATFVRRKLSETNVRDLLLGGRLIDAAEAVRIGLITRTVPEEQLDEAVDTIARNLATQTSRSAVAMTKQLLADLPGMSLRESLAYAASMNARARATADCQAGIVAFLDKKPMPWATNS
jgi:methylglutaconyl-CoA hydratase